MLQLELQPDIPRIYSINLDLREDIDFAQDSRPLPTFEGGLPIEIGFFQMAHKQEDPRVDAFGGVTEQEI